jgi:hypothetical protein
MRCLSKVLLFKCKMACLAFIGFILLPCQLQAQRGVEIKSKDDLSHKSGKLGAYRALVIGINNFILPVVLPGHQIRAIRRLPTSISSMDPSTGILSPTTTWSTSGLCRCVLADRLFGHVVLSYFLFLQAIAGVFQPRRSTVI